METNSTSKKLDSSKSHDGNAPEDPADTGHIGQRVEQ